MCNDGWDDDCDGRIDCSDADCSSAANCTTCRARNQSCSTSADCCAGLTCRSNKRCR
jgi:hypothetical protein